VKLDPSRAWCPVLECQAVCSVQASTEGQPAAVACPTCHTVFCSSCRGPWVDTHTCHERQPMIPPPLSDESRLVSCPHSPPGPRDIGQMLHLYLNVQLKTFSVSFNLSVFRQCVVGILMGVSIIVLVTSPLLLLASPCILCCMCKPCSRKKKKRKRDPSLQDPSSS
ncbi:hypothetical protein XENOCAPTIV_028898, partial [Xenoophorus captivus]